MRTDAAGLSGGSHPHYHGDVVPAPPDTDDWLALTAEPLDVDVATGWVGRPDCGAVVLFSGLVRDHAEGTVDVTHIDYEAYEDQVLPRLGALADEIRRRWPDTGRIVLWHRVGTVQPRRVLGGRGRLGPASG